MAKYFKHKPKPQSPTPELSLDEELKIAEMNGDDELQAIRNQRALEILFPSLKKVNVNEKFWRQYI